MIRLMTGGVLECNHQPMNGLVNLWTTTATCLGQHDQEHNNGPDIFAPHFVQYMPVQQSVGYAAGSKVSHKVLSYSK
jgi:hypothetical protein